MYVLTILEKITYIMTSITQIVSIISTMINRYRLGGEVEPLGKGS